MDNQPEVWLRGPVAGVPDALMPAAHAFLQTMEDVTRAALDLSTDQLWQMPAGAASVGFHILHLAGSTDRLLTYARGARLSLEQRAALTAEQAPERRPAADLIADLQRAIDGAIAQLRRRRCTSRGQSGGRHSPLPSSGSCSMPRNIPRGTPASS
jgi:hypothetical protein